jgi:hypothetical protein
MSDTEQTQEGTAPSAGDDVAPTPPTELEVLKSRARTMGITFSNNITVETLRKKISDRLAAETPAEPEHVDGQDDDADDLPVGAGLTVDAVPAAPVQPSTIVATNQPVIRKSREQQIRDDLIAEQMKLVRCRIANLDPKKKDLPGEIFTIANEYLGTVRKFVPFGEATDNGYHLPYCLYQMLDEKRFLNIRVRKVDGRENVSHVWSKEFALEILPQLTEAELARLAASQAAAGIIETGLED